MVPIYIYILIIIVPHVMILYIIVIDGIDFVILVWYSIIRYKL